MRVVNSDVTIPSYPSEMKRFQKDITMSKYFAILLALTLIVLSSWKIYDIYAFQPCPFKWHGGSPTDSHVGSCWCGNDMYCMCTPSLAIDVVIEFEAALEGSTKSSTYFVFVERRDPPFGVAIPGGFVNVGETVENAAIRELKEETNLTVSRLEQFKLYSDPTRDKRRHTASMVYRCVVHSIGELHSGDDAKRLKVVKLADVRSLSFAFDHSHILHEYLQKFHPI